MSFFFKVFFFSGCAGVANKWTRKKKCPDEQTQKGFLQKLLPNASIFSLFFKGRKIDKPPVDGYGNQYIPWNIAQSFFIFDIIPTLFPCIFLLKECDKNHNIMVCGLSFKDDDAKNWIQSSFLSISHFLDDVSLDYNPFTRDFFLNLPNMLAWTMDWFAMSTKATKKMSIVVFIITGLRTYSKE